MGDTESDPSTSAVRPNAQAKGHSLQLLAIVIPAVVAIITAAIANWDKLAGSSSGRPSDAVASDESSSQHSSAIAFYRKHVARIGHGDVRGYANDFADNVRCYYNLPNLDPARIRERRAQQLAEREVELIAGTVVTATARANGEIDVWDGGGQVRRDGKLTATERLVTLVARGNTYRIVAETDQHAHDCLPEFP